MDISLGIRKLAQLWHSQEVAQVLHGVLSESVWWGIFGTLQHLRKRSGGPAKDCSSWGLERGPKKGLHSAATPKSQNGVEVT